MAAALERVAHRQRRPAFLTGRITARLLACCAAPALIPGTSHEGLPEPQLMSRRPQAP